MKRASREAARDARAKIARCVAADEFQCAEVFCDGTAALFISEEPRGISNAREQLKRRGVGHVYSLCAPPRGLRGGGAFRGFARITCLMEDSVNQSLDTAEIREMVANIVSILRTNERALVHCSAGVNRSSAIVALVLCEICGVAPNAAIAMIRAAKAKVSRAWLTFDGAGGRALQDRVIRTGWIGRADQRAQVETISAGAGARRGHVAQHDQDVR